MPVDADDDNIRMLGTELTVRIDVPFKPVFYPSVGALFDAARAGGWDVTFNGITADRAVYLDVTAPHLEIEFGYLISRGARHGDCNRALPRVCQ